MNRTLEYNTAEVRKLIVEAFSDEELRAFCFDNFPPVYAQISDAITKTMVAQLLIEYCSRYGKMKPLLDMVRDVNPYQFDRHRSSFFKPTLESNRSSNDTAIIELRSISGASLATLDKAQQEGLDIALRGVLAGFLRIPVEKVVLLGMMEGSVIFRLEIPVDSLRKLIEADRKSLAELLGVELHSLPQQNKHTSQDPEKESEHFKPPRNKHTFQDPEKSPNLPNILHSTGTKKLYVGNLSFEATEDQIRELFSQFGDIRSIAMINDRDTGRFRGFAFVEMEGSAADAAIKALNGMEVDGRELKVNEARPREARPDVGNLPPRGSNRYPKNRGRGYRD